MRPVATHFHGALFETWGTCIYYDPYLGNVGEVTDYNGRERCLAAANGQDASAIMKETDEMITHV